MIDSPWILIAGAVIVIIITLDFFYTTLSFNGAGPVNKITTVGLSSFFLFLTRRLPGLGILRFSGLCNLLLSLILWVGLLWLGLFLMLVSDSTSVVHSTSGEPADIINKIYFSGYVLSTMGNGDYAPSGEGWEVIVAFFSFSGFIFLTTAISYLLNITSAVHHKRSLSLYISNLGKSPEEIIMNTYKNGKFSLLIERIPQLQEKLNKHSQNHFAYPVVHFFYSTSRNEALAVNMTNLDEALTIIQHSVERDSSVDYEILPLREAIDGFLDVVQYSFIQKLEEQTDASPDWNKLRKSGIKLTEPELPGGKLIERRALLAGFLKSSDWCWSDVYPAN
ncbi:MAG: potassium channel family protein [Balneolaceae bacterium]